MAIAQTPQGLAALYSLPPEAVMSGMRLEDMMGQQDNMALQNQQRQLAYDTAADPMNLEKLSLGNQTSQAHLPGIQAESAMKQRKNQYEDIFNDEAINSIRGKYKSEDLDRHISDIGSIGTLFQQGAEDVYNSPVGGAQRVKARLAAAGHGDMWNPIWEGLPPDQLQRALRESGDALANTVPKLRSSLLKEASAEKIAAGNNQTALDVEQKRIDAGKYTKKVAQATTFEESYRKLKKASEKYAALIDGAKEIEKDSPELAASFRARAADLENLVKAELAAGGTATISQVPGQRPEITPKDRNVTVAPGGPKQGTAQNPIKLD